MKDIKTNQIDLNFHDLTAESGLLYINGDPLRSFLLNRNSISGNTISLSPNQTDENFYYPTDAKSLIALVASTNQPARVRLYSSSGQRTLDLDRSVETDLTGDHGCLLEFVTASYLKTIVLSPSPVLFNTTGGYFIYGSVQNLSSNTTQVGVEIVKLNLEN